MILEITLSSDSSLEKHLKKQRFYLFRKDKGVCYYRKYWNNEDFIEQNFVKNGVIISHRDNPKEYKRLRKLMLKNKDNIENFLFFSNDFKKVIYILMQDKNFSFCFSESFEKITYKDINIEILMSEDFCFIYDELYRVKID